MNVPRCRVNAAGVQRGAGTHVLPLLSGLNISLSLPQSEAEARTSQGEEERQPPAREFQLDARCRAKSELPMSIYLGRGKGSRRIYIYIQSHTFPPRKRPREHILHEKVSRLLLFKSWGCAPKGSLWRASGDGSSLAFGCSEPRR